jgi:predicted ABC-type ATPase
LPNLDVIAGPTGAGKSTTAPEILRSVGVQEFVNADVIASSLAPSSPGSVAIKAGRLALQRMHALAGADQDFAIETTLSGQSYAGWFRVLQIVRKYRIHLFFIWLPTAEQSIERVARRFSMGGHSIPPEVIRRRHALGLRNFFDLYAPIADYWALYENSSQLKRVAEKPIKELPKVYDRAVWEAMVKSTEVREVESTYGNGAAGPEIMGVPTISITEAMQRAVKDAWRRHKALGHPIVILRDGKVVEVPPEEIEITA